MDHIHQNVIKHHQLIDEVGLLYQKGQINASEFFKIRDEIMLAMMNANKELAEKYADQAVVFEEEEKMSKL